MALIGSLLLALLAVPGADAVTSSEMQLSPQDYIDIEQLTTRYTFAIDHCTNSGYDYADLYTQDGEFGVASDWDAAPARTSKGRDALAQAAGGGPGGCRDPKTLRGYGVTHVSLALVVTPTATGASGTSMLLALGVGGSPTKIERQGGYKDEYVRTAAGWRIKRRWHVFPNMATSVQFGSQNREQTPYRASVRATAGLPTAGMALVGAAAGQSPPHLTAQDYIDIRMLSARYAQLIEHCTNKGYDYAGLYTPDGEFGGTDQWDVPPKKPAKGPDALATAANGGPDGCKDAQKWMGNGLTHIIVNTVITPTATGAAGKSFLVMLGVQHDPTRIIRLGGYQDTYVKTAEGWRFKTRWLVWAPGRSSADILGPAKP